MKTAKPPGSAAPAMEASSSRRSQPVRQTRTNPARSAGGPAKGSVRDTATGNAPGPEQPIPIFPGITHFADAITALPKEVVKHFTLLKEVDSKLHSPEKNLFALVKHALDTTDDFHPSQPTYGALDEALQTAIAMSAQNNPTATGTNGKPPVPPPNAPHLADMHKFSRLELFQHVGGEAREMLIALEEKCHVITVANEAMNKQLMRIEEIWPHLCEEFSDEAKWGSTTHWAYPENRAGRANNAQAERTRREGAASLSAAAQAIAEEHAARSDARKQAVAAKKSNKNPVQESDFDDADGKNKPEPTKKSNAKSRKPAGGESPATVGLGITNASSANGNPAPKRRKVDKTANGAAPPERAMASVFGSNAAKTKASSPSDTPGPEAPTKKRKALPTSASQAKKSRNEPGPPSIISSPVIGAFPDPPKPGRSSPAPPAVPRPAPSRARQNSTHSAMENGRQRAPSSASVKPSGVSVVLPELAPQSNGSRPHIEKNKEPAVPARPEIALPDSESAPPSNTATTGGQKKDAPPKADTVELKKEPTPTISAPTPITTKSGRASKPSTPALATFAEAATARSRPSRAGETAAGAGATTAKRSHKKGASSIANITQKEITAINNVAKPGGGETGGGAGTKRKAVDNDPLYCVCNQHSYGDMVACDAPDCEREWFHWNCVGLKEAPPTNSKWYCNDCKARLNIGARKSAGR